MSTPPSPPAQNRQIKIHARRLRGHAQGRPAGGALPRHADRARRTGVPTEKIDRLVYDYAMDHGALRPR